MATATTAASKLSRKAATLLKEQVNDMLAAPGGTREGRIALSVLLERNLHDAGIYLGYHYLEIDADGLRRWHDFIDRSRGDGLYDEVYDEVYDAEYKRRYVEAFGDDSRRYYR
jgi:hypothetical protein